MKWSGSGRIALACAVSIALLLGMSACGGGTVGYLWVLAGKGASNTVGPAITGFKIDDFTGNLTEIVHSPFATPGGGTPVYGVVLSGGRYVYVLNQGDPNNAVTTYSVGGDGVLTPNAHTQPSVGGTAVWMDISGSLLFVLDQVSPAVDNTGAHPACVSPTNPSNTLPCGSVEVFQITSDTGQLTPVLNTSIKVNNAGIGYFPVGTAPTRMKVFGSNLFVVNSDATVTSLTITPSTGQLTTSANSTQVLDQSGGAINVTSITASSSYLYLTDGANNRIFQYTVSNGVLQNVNGSPYANLQAGTTPVWTLTATDSSSNQFLYVVNSGSSSSTSGATGTVSIFQVVSNGRLTPISSTQSNPYTIGAFPTCLAQDSSKQYIYSSNQDGTVTGYVLRRSIGQLEPLRRGSTFTAAGKPTCLINSGILS